MSRAKIPGQATLEVWVGADDTGPQDAPGSGEMLTVRDAGGARVRVQLWAEGPDAGTWHAVAEDGAPIVVCARPTCRARCPHWHAAPKMVTESLF